ncbi:hypothetical protein QTA57_17125 [Fontisubflavum oceani]|uniref:hypothetical protein n=1 Tax=Fontisubflavum oceani TaxID=2978973 RepID=UPI0025B3DF6A|nr:hypothetical protein [Fontisubflavum oceani]WJY21450.1 hypothetical protein QTA57_17125 [Fontisubflavum oceani]
MAPIRLLFAALFLPLPVWADGLSAPEAALLPRIIDHGCFDIRSDLNGCESVILLTSETDPDAADLVIYPDRRTGDATGPLLLARAVAFNGSMWGTSPSLAQADNGSLLVHSEQSGIGRAPWFQTLTIAWRDDAFVVAGFSYATYDRLTARDFHCDLNILTGDYTHELRIPEPGGDGDRDEVIADQGRGPGAHIPLTDWDVFGPLPAPCNTAIRRFYAE